MEGVRPGTAHQDDPGGTEWPFNLETYYLALAGATGLTGERILVERRSANELSPIQHEEWLELLNIAYKAHDHQKLLEYLDKLDPAGWVKAKYPGGAGIEQPQ